MPPIIHGRFVTGLHLGKEKQRVKMGTAFQIAIFTSNEISNFVTRPTKQLHKQLEMAWVQHLVREIVAGCICQRYCADMERCCGLRQTPAHVIVDPVFFTPPALAAGGRLFPPFRADALPDVARVDAHLQVPFGACH